MTTPDAEAVASCEHAVIQTWRTEDGVVRLWACADCRLRFHPATLARNSEREALVAALDETMWPYWRTMAIDPDRHTFEVAVRGMAARLSVFHGLTANAAIEGGR